MKRNKIIGMFLFIFGFLILIYPLISRTYYDYVYRQEVEQINQAITSNANSSELYQEQLVYNATSVSQLTDIEVADVGFVEDRSKDETDFTDEDVLGTLSIPAIDMNYPIYDGATDENLYNGVARVEGTSYPVGGLNINSVIAGHNGLVGKTYFSDIKDLVNGDIIEIQNRHEVIRYEVYDNTVIEPTDVAALAIIPGQDTLTLLTCTSPPPGTHRYLVYARRVDIPEEESSFSKTVPNKTGESYEETNVLVEANIFIRRYGLLIGAVILGLFATYFIFIRKKGDSDE